MKTTSTEYHKLSVAWGELQKEQDELAQRVVIKELPTSVKFIGGCDCSIREKIGFGVFVTLKWPELEEVECQHTSERFAIPYRSGFLGFREVPLLINAYYKLKSKPDLILVDGQGIAHPRRLGLASHLGVLINKPTIGCAKSRLIGSFKIPGKRRGSYSALTDKGEKIGYVLRTRDNVRCLYISPGHLVSFKETIDWVIKLSPRYRLPEPIRRAHNYTQRLKMGDYD